MPLIWTDYDWDYYYLLRLMEKKLEAMSVYHKHHGVTTDASKIARQLNVCRILCNRLREEDVYYEGFREHFILSERAAVLNHMVRKKQDTEYLTKMFSKYLLTWWD